ncbi:claudin-15 isoform X1 [Cervus elaphus]|uniref:claudin-15 isoform X1 n=1 Tax=Cervus elaphus TaxID=9860 RepID=UPI001CC2E001|nr:claudin-15 isoform X1 [Cervus elaphus]
MPVPLCCRARLAVSSDGPAGKRRDPGRGQETNRRRTWATEEAEAAACLPLFPSPAWTTLLGHSPLRFPRGPAPPRLWGPGLPSGPVSHHARGCGDLRLLPHSRGAADAGGDPGAQQLASVHRARERHHRQHHLREPLVQLCHRLHGSPQLLGVPIHAGPLRLESRRRGKGRLWDPWLRPASPGYIQACRALMITAILLGFLGLLLGMVGLRCTNIGGLELSRKTKLAAAAGALHILAGLAGFSGSSPRYLRDGGRLLVRLQHHQGLLRPLVRWNQVRAGPCPLPGLERLPACHPGRHLPLLQLLLLSGLGPRRRRPASLQGPRDTGRQPRCPSARCSLG